MASSVDALDEFVAVNLTPRTGYGQCPLDLFLGWTD